MTDFYTFRGFNMPLIEKETTLNSDSDSTDEGFENLFPKGNFFSEARFKSLLNDGKIPDPLTAITDHCSLRRRRDRCRRGLYFGRPATPKSVCRRLQFLSAPNQKLRDSTGGGRRPGSTTLVTKIQCSLETIEKKFARKFHLSAWLRRGRRTKSSEVPRELRGRRKGVPCGELCWRGPRLKVGSKSSEDSR